MLVAMEPEWIYRFEVPNPAALARIESLLQTLPVVSPADWHGSQLAQQEGQTGDLAWVMKSLQTALESDYEDNIQEAQPNSQKQGQQPSGKSSYHFDYVLMRDMHTESGIGIYTRYYTPGEPGNIYYGRTVLRLTETDYRLWLD